MDKERNADIMQQYIGETIIKVQDTNSGHWTDGDGFIIEFASGRAIEIVASEGQGLGFIIVEEVH